MPIYNANKKSTLSIPTLNALRRYNKTATQKATKTKEKKHTKK